MMQDKKLPINIDRLDDAKQRLIKLIELYENTDSDIVADKILSEYVSKTEVLEAIGQDEPTNNGLNKVAEIRNQLRARIKQKLGLK